MISLPPISSFNNQGDPASVRAALALALKPLHAEAFGALKSRFEEKQSAEEFMRGYGAWMDELTAYLFEVAKTQFALPAGICVMAVGGYGRRELFPFSDIDLAILYKGKAQHTKAEALAGFLVPVLWDLGLNVGQSLRTVEETMKVMQADVTICTSLLDARLLAGDKTLYAAFEKSFHQNIESASAIEFVERKLLERDERHKKLGDSRFVLEPNLKEGKGGLRDLHMLYWLTRYIYKIKHIDELVALGVLTKEELRAYKRAEGFLWKLRTLLHLLSGRAEERLTFDTQRSLAEKLGYEDDESGRAVEQFMKRYYQTATIVGSLTRSICAVLEENKKRKPRRAPRVHPIEDFVQLGERLSTQGDDFFAKDPVRLITLFMVAHREKLDIHPHALQQVSRNLSLIDKALRADPRANQAFLDILLSQRNPEPSLRLMKEAGVLGRFIPDFGRVIGQMQFDMYHVFTVDEHTLIALGILHGISQGKFEESMPISTRIWPLVKSRRVLLLALFCHDIAKGRGGDHSVLGEEVGKKLATRFGFEPQEIETVAWLVREHLLMSRTAFKRDLNDPKTIQDFVGRVQSPERLRLLLLLTVADIRAVGPTVWNGWKGALLRELYYKAEAAMGASDAVLESEQRNLLEQNLKSELPGWSDAEIEDYLALGSSSFHASIDAATHARIARMVKSLPTLPFPLTMDTRPDSFRAITELIICTPDQHGLFSKISGALGAADLNIAGAKIFTLKNGIAVDMFQVQDIGGVALERPERIARLAVVIEQVLSGQISLEKEFAKTQNSWPSRLDAFKVPPRVFIDNQLSAHHTVIEVGGRDRIGFLHMITKAISDLGLTIVTAHISTYGERAVDVFYVKDIFGMKIHHEEKIKQIRASLMQILSAGAEKQKKAS